MLRTVLLIAAVAFGTTVVAPMAGADTPHTSADAKKAWSDSSHQAEIAAEHLNAARQAQANAEVAATKATTAKQAADAKVTVAQHQVALADAKVAAYQTQLDQFANSSFQGANLDQLGALLTAGSADDFLDQASNLSQVAADTQTTMADASAAVDAAQQAKADATTAEHAAATAQAQAADAVTTAKQATKTATAQKTAMDSAVKKNHALFDKLTAAEKKAAAEAAAKAKAESEAKAKKVAEALAAAEAQGMSGAAQVGDSVVGGFQVDGGDAAGQTAAKAALTKIGGGYCYACDGPTDFDCSGLTTWAWGVAGVSIPRVSYEQANFPSVPLDELQPGDLVTYYSPVSHVAIYVGNGMVASAADESLGIILVPVDKGGPDPTGHRVPR